MQACPNSRCHFKTNQPGRLDHHLKMSPQCQAGYKAKSGGGAGPQMSFKKKYDDGDDGKKGKGKRGRR